MVSEDKTPLPVSEPPAPTDEPKMVKVRRERLMGGSAYKVPDFYLVCFPHEDQMLVYEQPILDQDFEGLLTALMVGTYPDATNILMVDSVLGVEDISRSFASAWWERIRADFKLGGELPPPYFIELWLESVAREHWALTPHGKTRGAA